MWISRGVAVIWSWITSELLLSTLCFIIDNTNELLCWICQVQFCEAVSEFRKADILLFCGFRIRYSVVSQNWELGEKMVFAVFLAWSQHKPDL